MADLEGKLRELAACGMHQGECEPDECMSCYTRLLLAQKCLALGRAEGIDSKGHHDLLG